MGNGNDFTIVCSDEVARRSPPISFLEHVCRKTLRSTCIFVALLVVVCGCSLWLCGSLFLVLRAAVVIAAVVCGCIKHGLKRLETV